MFSCSRAEFDAADAERTRGRTGAQGAGRVHVVLASQPPSVTVNGHSFH